MASSPTSQILSYKEETLNPTPIFRPETFLNPTSIFRPAGRPNPSFSQSDYWDSSFGSSSFSYNDEFTIKFKGKPFSWERIPGIPKQQSSKKKEYSGHLLPLPPAGTTISSTKKLHHHQEEISPKKLQKDPFLAALVECSKDDNHDNIWKGSSKITRTLSDRFGLINMYTSCKRTCTVSESIVYHPRQTPHYLLNRRSS